MVAEARGLLPDVRRARDEDIPRVARLTLWSLLGFFVFAGLWAHFAVVDEVTRADGKAIPSSRLQKIQNLEGGIVAELFVREGQLVEAGAPLVRLDGTRFASSVGESEADRQALLLRIERLEAEVAGREPVFPAELQQAVPVLSRGELALFVGRRQQLQDEVAGLEAQLEQRQQEMHDYANRREQYSATLALQTEEIRMSEPLVAEGAISPVEVLRLRRAELETRGQLDATRLAIPRAAAAFREVERKIDETRARFRNEALARLNEARAELNKLAATGRGLKDRLRRTLVTSPVRGIVKRLQVNTIGGVIQPGSDLVEIVPLDEHLLVEARIRPQDIAFLHPGQAAMVRFTAYDYTLYGGLPAHLEQIGADTVSDEDGNSFYLVQLRTERSHLGSVGEPLLIIPGMIASVDIVTGRKSILSYLLKPIIRARSEAFRER
jgi:adhesin transport system membrane fusion protein